MSNVDIHLHVWFIIQKPLSLVPEFSGGLRTSPPLSEHSVVENYSLVLYRVAAGDRLSQTFHDGLDVGEFKFVKPILAVKPPCDALEGALAHTDTLQPILERRPLGGVFGEIVPHQVPYERVRGSVLLDRARFSRPAPSFLNDHYFGFFGTR